MFYVFTSSVINCPINISRELFIDLNSNGLFFSVAKFDLVRFGPFSSGMFGVCHSVFGNYIEGIADIEKVI